MSSESYKHLYGPVPSRRLGRSLGIDLVPYKICSYDCVYCQLGSTGVTTVTRQEYVSNEEIIQELRHKLARGSLPDYISLAGSGEPTLHSGIGALINAIKAMTAIPVAVLTNGSLLWMPEVQDSLLMADLVLPSLDAGDAATFKKVNRPAASISFDLMVQGLEDFTRRFSGDIWLEVFLLAGVTDTEKEVRKIAELVERIKPARVQLNSVYRPPAEESAIGLTLSQIQLLSHFFPGSVEVVSETANPDAEQVSQDLSRQDEIVALIRRRPCTATDIATGLKMHLNDVLKQLSTLTASGQLFLVAGKSGFYQVPKH